MAEKLMTLHGEVLAAVAALASVFASACGDNDTGATATMEQPESRPNQPSRTWSLLTQGERDLSTLVEAVTAADSSAP